MPDTNDKLKIEDGAEMTVGGHLDELRSRIVKSAIAIFVIAIVAFIYRGFVLDIIFGPMQPDFITNKLMCKLAELTHIDVLCINQNHVNIVNTKMAGQFNLHIKSSIIAGLVLSMPYILWQFWAFIRPALNQNVIKNCRSLVFQVSLWFFSGLLFGYFIIAPLTVNFLTNYVVSDNIVNMIEMSSFMSSVLGVSLATAVVFQLPLVVRLLSTMGILTPNLMRQYRRFAAAFIIILAAVITPPDIFSQILVAIPLYFLYEYSIIISAGIEKKRLAKGE